MASGGPSKPGVPEMDEFEAMWSKHVETKDPDICESQDIDPSQPGWEITLHLFGKDPKQGETQLAKDYSLLRSLESIGILTMEYVPKGGNNTIVLTHKDESPLEHFMRDYRELFDRYSPLIKAPMSARREASAEDEPETMRPPSSAPAPKKENEIAAVSRRSQEKAWKALEQKSPRKKASGRQKIENFQFDSIITTIPFDHPQQEKIRQSLQWACEEENLEYQEEGDGSHYDITMDKKDGAAYSHMKPNNLLAIYNVHVLHKLPLSFF